MTNGERCATRKEESTTRCSADLGVHVVHTGHAERDGAEGSGVLWQLALAVVGQVFERDAKAAMWGEERKVSKRSTRPAGVGEHLNATGALCCYARREHARLLLRLVELEVGEVKVDASHVVVLQAQVPVVDLNLERIRAICRSTKDREVRLEPLERLLPPVFRGRGASSAALLFQRMNS